MKKKLVVLVLITLFTLSLIFVARQQYGIYMASMKQKNTAKRLPALNLTSIDGKKFNISSFKELSKFKLFVIFNSDCDHCDYQITELINNARNLNKFFVFFISAEPVSTLKKYGEKFNIARFDNMLMLNLDFTSLRETFDCPVTPALYLYNTDNILVRQYKGETPVKILLKEIN
jgi:peroxiredoxin